MRNVQAVLFLLFFPYLISFCVGFNKGTNLLGTFSELRTSSFPGKSIICAWLPSYLISMIGAIVCRRHFCLFVVDIRSFQTNNCHQLPLWLGERVETWPMNQSVSSTSPVMIFFEVRWTLYLEKSGKTGSR